MLFYLHTLGSPLAPSLFRRPLYALRNGVIETGVLFYLHTAAGGAAWGLFESVRQREPRAMLIQNVLRTSLVTCFVPILLVGGVVSTYTHLNRTTDTINDKFQLFFASSMALYPAHKLLQVHWARFDECFHSDFTPFFSCMDGICCRSSSACVCFVRL